nr:glutamate--cysteine ligase [Acidithiobacillus sp. AMEEHan]
MISVLSTPPRLVTNQVDPLHELEEHLIRNQCAIERWFRCQWQTTPPPFYGSVDLRNAGFKLAPIDTNLFPAGFNNLNPDHEALHITAIQHYLDQYHPSLQRLLLIPENHTRNLHYLENVARLAELLREAGLELRIASWMLEEAQEHKLPSGERLLIEPLRRVESRLQVDDFDPQMILLNNDLSGGVPEILRGLEQPLLPPWLPVGRRGARASTSPITGAWQWILPRSSILIPG